MNANLNQPSPLRDMHEAVSAWFLGPRAENFSLLKELFAGVLDEHAVTRELYHPEDGAFITNSIKESSVYKANIDALRQEVTQLSLLLNEYSVPFFSPRYIGHMNTEVSLPAVMGWIMTIMFNPNNVAFEGSPTTTIIELEVGKQLCKLLGYNTEPDLPGEAPKIKGWGHIACDGTVANMESLWASRNLKFYPLSLRAAIDEGEDLAFIGDTFKIKTAGPSSAEPKLLKDLSAWELLNIPTEEILSIGDRLRSEYAITSKALSDALAPYLIQSAGRDVLTEKYGIKEPPQYFVSSTKHYSWPKGAALVGVGSDNCVRIPVDHHARVEISELRMLLDERLKKQQAVYGVIAIIGSTEEGSVDPLDEIIKLRDEYYEKGLAFIVHADAAWGGYFTTMIRDPPQGSRTPWDDQPDEEGSRDFVPSVTLRESTVKQLEALTLADSITIDPHKSGYVPYPAGGLCYRDGRMRDLVTFTAPYLHDSDTGESIGVYGIEGSKPGAPAAACLLHHDVIGLHKEGHGGLLGEVTFTCRRFSAHWAAMSNKDTDYIVMPFNMFVNEGDKEKVEEEKTFIRENIIGKSNEEIVQNEAAMNELCALGSDLNINAFACNFKINGETNQDVEEANYLNSRVFDRLSLTAVGERPKDIPLFLSSTVFGQHEYDKCVTEYKRRMGLETESGQDLFVLRNVVMSPFQGAGDYTQTLAEIFRSTLIEECHNVVTRNTVSPQHHYFSMQGTDKLFLVLHPRFHHASFRFQMILSANINDSIVWSQYQNAHTQNPAETYNIMTSTPVTLDELIQKGSFEANISGEGIDLKSVTVSDIQVVKRRPLDSRWRDGDYSKRFMPFYLYGTFDQQHIDHMLLKAPNAQLSADQVNLRVEPPLTSDHLARGVIVRLNRSEKAMQPIDKASPPSWFAPRASFSVVVFEDANDAIAQGPGLASGGQELAKGTLTLGNSVWVDYEKLNVQDFAPEPRVANYTSRQAEPAMKEAWQAVVAEHLHF